MNELRLKRIATFAALIALLAITFISPFANDVLAADSSSVTDLQKQLTQSTSNSQELKKELATKVLEEKNAESAYYKAESELQQIQVQIKAQDAKLKSTQRELEDIESKYKKTENDITELEINLAQKSDDIAELLNRVYRSGSPTYLEILFASSDLNDFLANYKYVDQIVTNQNDIFNSVKNDKMTLEEKRASLLLDKESIEAKKRDIEEIKAGLKKEEAKVAEKSEEKEYYLSILRKDITKINQQLDEEEKRSKELETQIRNLQSSNTTANYTGTYRWPVNKTSGMWISSEYGYRIHPITRTTKLHAGIDIAVSTGTSVYAAAPGKVITSSYLSGYGYTVIIDHGGNVSTVYAHNSKLLVSVGQTVKQGDRIALSGNSGDSTGPHCHFEVRINGIAQNPRNYLPAW